MLSFRARGSYPIYNSFADKMPPEVAEQVEADRLKDVARWWGKRYEQRERSTQTVDRDE